MTRIEVAHSTAAEARGTIAGGDPFRGSTSASPSGANTLERDPGMPSSTWRLRSDAWEYLRFAVKRISLGNDNDGVLSSDGEVFRSLRALETIELYWAGFGQRYVRAIRELLIEGDYSAALDRIGRVVNRLRGSSVPDEPRDEQLEEAERAELQDDADPRPRFEVLVVDETTEADRWRRSR
jgi:arginine decarboxylase